MKQILLLFVKLKLILILINICYVNADPRAIIYKGKVNIGLLIAAHSSNSSQSLCDSISVDGLHNAMANVWSLHMYNQRQRLNNFDEIGVFIYDTCDDHTLAKRQSVRLISHLFSIGNRICREAKGYPPLIGVIAYGRTFDTSLDLLSSFGVPIITTSDERSNDPKAGNIFTVAPTLKYLSNAVMAFVKELDWQSVSLVVSDDESSFDSQYLQSLSLGGRLALVKNYHDFDPNDRYEDVLTDSFDDNKEKIVSDLGRKRVRRRDQIFLENTIFFLSKSEAIDLLKSLSEISHDNQEINSNYSCIIVTTSDISSEWRTLKRFKPEEKLRNNIFLISPLMENTSEYQQYFETMVDTIGTKSDQPLISEYVKATKEINVPNMSVSAMAKAVWVLSEAYQNLYRKQCVGNTNNCDLVTNSNLTNMMVNSLRNLNAVINGSGHKELNGVKLGFDSEQKLTSWKFQIIIISTNWDFINLGFFSHQNGLNIDMRLLRNVIINRNKFLKTKPTTRTSSQKVNTNTLTSLSSNNLPFFKQAVYSFTNNSLPIPPSNLMRSSIRHQVSMASSPIGKISVLEQTNTTLRPTTSDAGHVTRRRTSSLTAWLGNMWSMIILGSCILGILFTLYVQTFLLLKSCEGVMRKANQGLVVCHLIAIMTTFLGSSLFVFYPTSFMCSLRNSTHNITLSLLFGSLLCRAMYIRAQKSIGLGGRASRLNQFLTLIFIVGIQTALELQKWKYESPWTATKNSVQLQKLCSNDGSDFMRSQIYLSIIVSLLLLMSWSARNTPFNQRDGTQVLIVSLLIAVVFMASILSNMNINKLQYRDIITSVSLNIYAFIVLFGLFIPLLYTIHKYGILLPKTSSYADSLSTIFTTFGGNHDLDNCSHNSDNSRNSNDRRKHKISKSFDFMHSNANNFFARVSPNSYTVPLQSHHNMPPHRNKSSLIPNPLYEGVPGFRSAYP